MATRANDPIIYKQAALYTSGQPEYLDSNALKNMLITVQSKVPKNERTL